MRILPIARVYMDLGIWGGFSLGQWSSLKNTAQGHQISWDWTRSTVILTVRKYKIILENILEGISFPPDMH